MPISSRISLIMGQIEPDQLELFALEFGKISKPDFVYTLAPTDITNQHQTWSKCMYHKISDEFDYEFNRTRTVRVICP